MLGYWIFHAVLLGVVGLQVQLDDGSPQTFGKLEVGRGCRQSAGSASCVLTSPTHKSRQDQSTQLPNIIG